MKVSKVFNLFRAVGNIKIRLAKLKSQNPKRVTVFRYVGFGGEPILTPEQEANLRAEEERLIPGTKTGFVFMRWTKDEAQRLSVMTRDYAADVDVAVPKWFLSIFDRVKTPYRSS
jgi:hypothetical protein